MKVVDQPVFQTVGVRAPADSDRLIVRRAALAVVLAFGVPVAFAGAEDTHQRVLLGRGQPGPATPSPELHAPGLRQVPRGCRGAATPTRLYVGPAETEQSA